MRIMILYGMNIYVLCYSLYILTIKWGWGALLLLFTGPAVAIFAPLLVWITTGDYLYFALLTLGNLVLTLLLVAPSMIDQSIPANKVTSSIRTFLIACFSIFIISQGISVIGVILSTIFNSSTANALAYIFSIIGGIYGGYCYVAFHLNSDFRVLTSKNILYVCAIPLITITLVGNIFILYIYALNSAVCLMALIYFIQRSSFPTSLKDSNLDLD